MAQEPNNPVSDSVPRRRDPDRTIRRILDRAVERFDRDGADGVVVTEIAREAGVSVGAVYHHFSGRSGLVAAARTEQFRRTTLADIDELERAMDAATTFEEFQGLNRALVRRNRRGDRVRARRERLAALVASETDAETQLGVRLAQAQLTAALTRAADRARERGWFADDVDAHAYAVMIQGLLLGAVVADLDDHLDESAWVALVERVQDLAIRPPDVVERRLS